MAKLLDLLRNNIRRQMAAKEVDQSTLARALGWPTQRVSEYLNKTEPGLDKIAAIAGAFGRKPWEMLDDGTGPSPHELTDCLAAVSAKVTSAPAAAPPPSLIPQSILDALASLDQDKRDAILVNLGRTIELAKKGQKLGQKKG